jgi:hypothetical protein
LESRLVHGEWFAATKPERIAAAEAD